MFWQRKDNRVQNHVVLLTPVKWRSQEASFPDEKKRKTRLPRNQRTYLQNGVLWRHYLHFLRNAWKFSNKISLLEHFCVLSMLPLARAWRSDHKMTLLWNESCFSCRSGSLAVPTTTIRNCWKQLPIFLSYLLEIYSLSRLKPTNSQLEIKMML